MGKKFLMIIDNMVFPLYCVVIFIAVFIEYMFQFKGFFVVRVIVVFLGAIPLGIANVIMLFRFIHNMNNDGENIIGYLYLNSKVLLKTMFTWYFFFYTLLELYISSVLFTYLLILIGGVYYGYYMLDRNTNIE